VVVGDESFEVSAVFLEVVVDALEVERFPDDRGVDGLDVSVELGRVRWQDEQSQSDLLAGGLEGSAELGAAVDLYLLDVDVLADLAEQVGCVGRAGGRVDAGPDAPRIDVDGADVVDFPAAGQAHVHAVHLDELPDPACLGGDPPRLP